MLLSHLGFRPRRTIVPLCMHVRTGNAWTRVKLYDLLPLVCSRDRRTSFVCAAHVWRASSGASDCERLGRTRTALQD